MHPNVTKCIVWGSKIVSWRRKRYQMYYFVGGKIYHMGYSFPNDTKCIVCWEEFILATYSPPMMQSFGRNVSFGKCIPKLRNVSSNEGEEFSPVRKCSPLPHQHY
ncbi:hypothetical protein CDAR_36021 [Caerostris darwini]|uniref:Uncharacterized protein n=1 Tax=Caerostris darwini TaxID=1538125 RepID=A0AAV4VCN1_9ARAC|nr:hypothetical protein CDAR_36021 [Caerostris darwini]